MGNTYNVKTSSRVILANILERQRYALSENLVLHGRGAKNYHLDRNQNLVYLLENFAGSPAPANPLDGQFWWDLQNQTLKVANFYGSPSTAGSPWQTVVPPGQGVGFIVAAGQGLTYPGSPGVDPQSARPTGSPLTIELKVNAGTGITLTANTVNMVPSAVDHDSLSGFVSNEHIDHSSLTITGYGIVGGGPLTAYMILSVNTGTGGLIADSNTVRVNSTVVRTTGNQFVDGIKTFTQPILAPKGSISAASYSFYSDADTGIYHYGGANGSPSILGFAAGSSVPLGSTRFTIDNKGVLRARTGVPAYETLVTEDDDIPNKKYVDDAAASAGGVAVTQNTFTGTSTLGVTPVSISGLTPGKKYLVSVYGIMRNPGTGTTYFGGIRITSSSTPTSGLLYQGPTLFGNWPDGNPAQHSMAVITAPAGGTIYGFTDYVSSGTYQNGRRMIAIQLN